MWDFGDGGHSTGTAATHTYTATGTYHVCATAYTTCGVNTVCRYDTVNCIAAPVSSFTESGQDTVSLRYTGTTYLLDSVVWNYGDGTHASGITAAHTYTATGTYLICTTSYTNCGVDSACRYDTVTCVAAPVPSFTHTGRDTVSFVYTGAPHAPDSVVWSFGDGHAATGNTATNIYADSGTYRVCATAYTRCGVDSTCANIHVTFHTVGLEALSEQGIKVYPNPANDALYVTGVLEISTYRILSVAGTMLKSGALRPGMTIIPVQDLVPGIYLLEITGAGRDRTIVRVARE